MMNKWLCVALCALLTAGCKKDEDLLSAGRITPDEPAVFMPKAICRPVTIVRGPAQFASVLNSLATCEITVCPTASATVNRYVHPLADAGGTTLVFVTNPLLVFSPAMQQQALDAAYNWAWANRPAGYSIKRMFFSPTTEYDWPTTYRIRLTLSVDYVLCEGAGGCTPYQTLVGPEPLLQELNRIRSGACIGSAQACEGAHVSTVLTAAITGASGNPILITAFDPNGAYAQNSLLSAADAKAAAMKPAGYTITDIDFFLGPNGEVMISVRYMKCIGGGNT